MGDEITTCVALLHDMIEDTEWPFYDLIAEDIPPATMDALRLKTRNKDAPYMDYIRRIATNLISAAVKLSDLSHNMDETRYCRPMNDHDRARISHPIP